MENLFSYDTKNYNDYQKIAQGNLLFNIGKSLHEKSPDLLRELGRIEKHGESSWNLNYKELFELGENKVKIYNKYKKLHHKI